MSTLKTEAIILHVLDFRDFDQILTVFSGELGIMKFVFKRGQSAKKKKGAVSSPLIRGEFIYRNQNRELLYCEEFSVCSHYMHLRKSYDTLEAACEMIRAIQQTQLVGKPAPLLYRLLHAYLEGLSDALNPSALNLSFLLKLLRHEGHLGNLTSCSLCQSPLKSGYLKGGESYCEEHAGNYAIPISEEELGYTLLLAYSQNLSQIYSLIPSMEFNEKIRSFFRSTMDVG